MKYEHGKVQVYPKIVAPYLGAWIEIIELPLVSAQMYHVAPYLGAWIEIVLPNGVLSETASLLT